MYRKIISIGVALHVLFLISVFDIYFRSPIIRSLEPVKNGLEPEAHRLVLFVADGLRADYFFKYPGNKTLSPFLRKIIERKGSWGLSHTQVPTESRPGHVALMAGIYEDPSAVFKGWKDNIVDFDSVFNESYATFAFGSPDILPIFSRGNLKNNIHNFMYGADLQDLSGTSGHAAKLNYWVLDEFINFFNPDNINITLKESLQHKEIVFFFHLLGTDVAGHANKPGSKEYDEAIISADYCVQNITQLINSYYNDDKTAFIYTADHGMTDWGSHGDGSAAETETPVVAWGAGIRGPKLSKNESPKEWGLGDLHRSDMNQADMAPLMSILIGIPIPVNSVGELPYDYLDVDAEFLTQALSLNWQQLEKQYQTSLRNVKNKMFTFFYYPFDENETKETWLKHSFNVATSQEKSVGAAKMLISFYLNGIQYYTNYFSTILKGIVSFLYIVWLTHLFTVFIIYLQLHKVKYMANENYLLSEKNVQVFLCIIGAVISVIFLAQHLEWSFYIYSYVILYLLYCIFLNLDQLKNMRFKKKYYTSSTKKVWSIYVSNLLGHAIIIYCLVYSFFNRSLLAILMTVMAAWPIVFFFNIVLYQKFLFLKWAISCLSIAVFPLAPTVGSYYNIYIVFIATFIALILAVHKFMTSPENYGKNKPAYDILSINYAIALINLLFIEFNFSHNVGLTIPCQIASWSLLIASIGFVTVGSVMSNPLDSFYSICWFLCTPFFLLSLAHESFFPIIFIFLLTMWVRLEDKIHKSSLTDLDIKLWHSASRSITTYLRIALFYLAFTILSFFGIGNIASLNSFDPTWTRSFLTTFSPFTMMILIILKSVIPMIMVSSALQVILRKCFLPFEPIMIAVIIFSDIIGLQFFFRVTNKGSWLTIGMSISHFVLIEAFILVILLLHWLVEICMSGPHLPFLNKYLKKVSGMSHSQLHYN